MEEKEWDEDDDNVDDIVDITSVQWFGIPDKEFICKETDNNKNKEEEEEKSKKENDDGDNNRGGGAKREKNMRGGIDRFASKGDNKDDADLCDDHNFDVEGKEGTEWETTKGMKKTTKRARRRRRRKKRRGESASAENTK